MKGLKHCFIRVYPCMCFAEKVSRKIFSLPSYLDSGLAGYCIPGQNNFPSKSNDIGLSSSSTLITDEQLLSI